MFSLEIECPPEGNDLLAAELWEQGSTGIVELTPSRVRAFFDDEADRAALIERFHPASWRTEDACDWVALSRTGWDSLAVGKRFYLVPEWRDDPAPEGRFRIVVNPGLAFGTGRHETTRLCMEAMETYMREGMAVLDVGTGCGILAQAAALLGGDPIWACDLDPDAVEIARGVAGTNLFVGSVDAVRTASAGLLAANISPEAIVRLAPDLMRSLRPSGIALLSGFERHEAATVQAEMQRYGAIPIELRHDATWALLVVQARSVTE